MSGSLQAGVGRAVITPPLGTELMGYPVDRHAEAVLDDLTVTALALKQEKTVSILLSVSTTIADDEVTKLVRQAVSEAVGTDPFNVNYFAWQIHTGPKTQTCWGWGDRDEEYCRKILAPKAAEAAKAAMEDLGPVTVGVAETRSDVGINRRQIGEDGSVGLGQNPWGPYDPTMTAICFRRDGKPYANVIHYGAHPTAAGPVSLVTRDWPGVMVDRVEALIGGTTLFFNGAVGDVGPRPSEGGTCAGIEGMKEVGYRAGADAVRACRSVKQFAPVSLEVILEDILIPYRPILAREEAEAALSEAETHRGPGMGEAEYRYLQAVLDEYTNGTVRDHDVRRQVITRIGDVALVPFPGEPFAEIVLRLRHYSPVQHTLAVSTANGSIGYIATRDSLHRGGYEVFVAKAFSPYILAENIDDVLIRENLALLRKLTL